MKIIFLMPFSLNAINSSLLPAGPDMLAVSSALSLAFPFVYGQFHFLVLKLFCLGWEETSALA